MCGDLWPVNLVGMEDEKHATFCEFIFQVVPNRISGRSGTAPGGLGQAVYVNAAVVVEDVDLASVSAFRQ